MEIEQSNVGVNSPYILRVSNIKPSKNYAKRARGIIVLNICVAISKSYKATKINRLN